MENSTPVSTTNTTKSLFSQDNVKQKFKELLGSRSSAFMTSVLQIVSSNVLLSKADPHSVFNVAATAATLDLPLNNNLGFAYIIPYNQKYKDDKGNWQTKVVAQFQIGYKGFIQLGQRTGLYKNISATPIYEGELISSNPLTGHIFDFTKRSSETIIGFASYFSLMNGFEKMFYMTLEEMNAHGAKFSKSYKNEDSLWKKDFIGMGNKTVLKLLLSKFGPMSIEMQKAITTDQAVINDENATDVTYIDNQEEQVDKESERILLMIEDCKKLDEVLKLEVHCVTQEQKDAFKKKREELA